MKNRIEIKLHREFLCLKVLLDPMFEITSSFYIYYQLKEELFVLSSVMPF